MNTYKATPKEKEAIELVLKKIEEVRPEHDRQREKIRSNMRAYEGIVEMRRDIAEWTSKRTPPYALSVIEGIVANMLDDDLSFAIRPLPRGDQLDQIENLTLRARAIEEGLRHEYAEDHVTEKMRDFVLQNSIAGWTVAKNYWRYDTKEVIKSVPNQTNINDPETGLPIGQTTEYTDVAHHEITRDGPCFEVLDLNDFFTEFDAKTPEDAGFMAHRLWMDESKVKKMADTGIWNNTEFIVYDLEENGSEGANAYNGDITALKTRRKNLCEVIEFWLDDRVITIANRSILLRDEPNPFQHGEKPFIIASGIKRPFRMTGIADIDLIKQLQECMWEFLNQRLDNMALINNAVMILGDEVDENEFYYAPGAIIKMRDPGRAQMWQPNTNLANLSLEAEQDLMNQIQTVTGGTGMTPNAQATIDNQTATQASIVTTLAQRRLKARRDRFYYALKRKAQQDISNMRQFMTDQKWFVETGTDGNYVTKSFGPEDLDDIAFSVDVEIGSETTIQQEKIATMNALVQTLGTIAPIMAQANGVTINFQEVVADLFREHKIYDTDKYFTKPATPPDQMQGAQSAPAAPGPGGVTNPSAAAGPLAPSNQNSISPLAAMQQQLASTGGPRNT